MSLGIVLSGIRFAQTGDPPVGSPSSEVCAKTGSEPDDDPEVVGILDALRDKDPSVRFDAIMRVKEVGPRAKAAVPQLIELWGSKEDDTEQIEKALADIGPAAIPWLEAIQDKDARRRKAAASALALYGSEAKPAVPALVMALQDHKSGVRARAAYALASIGQDAREATPALIRALNDDEGAVRSGSASEERRLLHSCRRRRDPGTNRRRSEGSCACPVRVA
ncbi:MAG: HEAT repeat domain-containing protein [Planctomycetes bacterium]|nr:HEAT repeat domain-containing protein [Planctomycetota bacterium]